MSEVQADPLHPQQAAPKPLWPVAAMILTMVFAPAILAWALTLLHH